MKKTYCPNLKKMPISALFDALSDPIRIEIVLTLLDGEETSCGDCKSPLSKSTMSHHFKVLRECGIIQRRGEGKTHFLSLRVEEIEERMPGFLDVLRKLKKPM
ncbi:MAG: ArsR/SmtB family transcription factor [Bacteriovoracaceae bacterium]